MGYLKSAKPALFFEYDPSYFTAFGDDGLSTLAALSDIGYKEALFYDNLGRFLVSASLNDKERLDQLTGYIKGHNGTIPFYDLCIFHADDDGLARELIKDESFVNNSR
jgi:hypothetical protein